MKIAVCLSGQPRSIEYATNSTLNYFNSSEYEVDYFCHVWDYNTWKCKGDVKIMYSGYEPVDNTWLYDQIHRYNPKKFLIDYYAKLYPHLSYVPWGSLFYSMMYANLMKCEYEIENNFKYDYVVKSRYDLVFPPDRKFSPEPEIKERHLYFNHAGRMHYRYNIINASDPIFYGDSWGMDIIADSFFEIKQFYDMPYNKRADQLGGHDPGTFISQLANKYNVIIDIDRRNPGDTIYRKEMLGTDPFTDFDKLFKNHHSYYQPIV